MNITNLKKKLIYRKLFIVTFLLLILNLTFFIKSRADTADDIAITFTDTNLYQEIKRKLASDISNSNNSTNTIYIDPEILISIEELNLSSSSISDLTGLENFTGLKNLNLKSNELTSLNQLASLTELRTLDLSSNPTHKDIESPSLDITVLSQLSKLNYVNISNTGSTTLTPLLNLSNLETILASSNSIIDESYVGCFQNLKTLDISANTSITQFEYFTTITSLKNLNVSSTHITTLKNIYMLTNLESLDISSCLKLTTTNFDIFKYIPNSDPRQYYLTKLNSIKANNLTSNSSSATIARTIASNAYLLGSVKTIELSNDELTSISNNIAKLEDMEVLNLGLNKISDITFMTKEETIDGVKTLFVANPKRINLNNNEISDISPLGYATNLEYANISYNHIDDYSVIEHLGENGVKMDHQTFTYNIYRKDSQDQYIILPQLFQNYKVNGTFINTGNDYVEDNCYVNPADKYNQDYMRHVVLSKNLSTGDISSITIPDGKAAGSTLYFVQSTSSSAIDSIYIPDDNLSACVSECYNRLLAEKQISFLRIAVNVTNLKQADVVKLKELQANGKNITSLEGIQTLTGVTLLNLNKNNISDLSYISYLTGLKSLYISSNCFTDFSVIESLKSLQTLDLSLNPQVVNVDPIMNLVSKSSSTKLLHLNISNTNIDTLNQISQLTSLIELSMSDTKIRSLEKIVTLTNLVSLYNSNNYISDLTPLSSLSKLNNLELNNDNISDVSPLTTLTRLTKLSLSSNKLSNITPLAEIPTLTDLNLDNNLIADISPLSNSDFLIQTFSATKQKLTYDIASNTGTMTIPLPALFISSLSDDKYIASTESLLCEQCEISGNSVIVNLDNIKNSYASVKITDGNAKNSTFIIGKPTSAHVSYDIEEETQSPVVATVTFDSQNVKILNNDGNATYKFRKNGTFVFEYQDENGFYGTAVAVVTWIENNGMNLDYTLTPNVPTTSNVVVTITSEIEMKELDDWTLSYDKLSMRKEFSENTTLELKIYDDTEELFQEIEVVVNNIDREAPKISNVVNNRTYNVAVTPTITDNSAVTVVLTKDGETVEGYEKDGTISENGVYVLTATDAANNATTVTFTINEIQTATFEVSHYSLNETTKELIYITPNTTVSKLKSNISCNISYSIYSPQSIELTSNLPVTTGCTLRTQNNDVYNIYVLCDFFQKGEFEISNRAKSTNVYLDIDTKYDKVKYLDTNKDGIVNVIDKANTVNYYLGIKSWEY